MYRVKLKDKADFLEVESERCNYIDGNYVFHNKEDKSDRDEPIVMIPESNVLYIENDKNTKEN